MPRLVPSCVWLATPELIVALRNRFGDPVDAFVNGSQTWLRDDGPGDVTLEWRLHPVAGYRKPKDIGTLELFAVMAQAYEQGYEPPASLDELWDGLEVFPGFGDEVEPVPLAKAAEEALGLAPDYSGLVNHAVIGDAWERTGGRVSIVELLVRELSS